MKNRILKGLLVAVAVPFALVLGNPNKALGITVSSTVSGSTNPTRGFGSSLENGDFTIIRQGRGSLGDGVDENTRWVFDYANDPNLGAFSAANNITSALLTLTVKTNGVSTDSLFAAGGGVSMQRLVNDGVVSSFSSSPQTFTIDLLNYGFTSAGILGELNSSRAAVGDIPAAGVNQILFSYQDDVLISSAKLDLIAEAAKVPEPTTILGSLTAVAVGALLRRKRQQAESTVE